MLTKLAVKGFKSLRDVSVDFPRLTVLFGPNTAGKSNLLDSIQALSRIGTGRTLSDALAEPIRGYAIEAFSFPDEGLPGLLASETAEFTLGADLQAGRETYSYKVTVGITPKSGVLAVRDEYLAALNARGEVKGVAIEDILPRSPRGHAATAPPG